MNIGRKGLTWSLTWARRIVVAIVGFTVLLIGIALLVLPGPAFLVIPLGLAILATEFVWARSLLQKARETCPARERVRQTTRQANASVPDELRDVAAAKLLRK